MNRFRRERIMKYQRGLSMTGLMLGGAVLFIVSLVAMKVTPAWIEFASIKKKQSLLRRKTLASRRRPWAKCALLLANVPR